MGIHRDSNGSGEVSYRGTKQIASISMILYDPEALFRYVKMQEAMIRILRERIRQLEKDLKNASKS